MHSQVFMSSLQGRKSCFQGDICLSWCQGHICMVHFPSRMWDSQQISVCLGNGKLHPVGGLVILKDNPHHNLCYILAELHTMSWKDSSFGLQYTTCWMGDYVTSVVQYILFLFLSVPDTVSSDIDPVHLPHLILLIFWHWDTPRHPHPFFAILTRSAVSCPVGRMQHSKPPPLWGNSETPCPPRSICHHAECQKASLRLTSGHCSPWHSATEKERNREGHTQRENVEQRENEPDKGPETDPSHSAEPGEYAARLSAPLISQMQPLWQCDTDYWKPWFRLSLLLHVASMASAKAVGVCVRMCQMYRHYSSLIHSLSSPKCSKCIPFHLIISPPTSKGTKAFIRKSNKGQTGCLSALFKIYLLILTGCK